MNLAFPSREFNDAVAAVCHGMATDEQMTALNALLRSDVRARDEYILQTEVHSRLASAPEALAQHDRQSDAAFLPDEGTIRLPGPRSKPPKRHIATAALALAACIAMIWGGIAFWTSWRGNDRATSTAVAMLSDAVDARWVEQKPRAVGSPLEPGWLRLAEGTVQIGFYSGARVTIRGPAELKLISAREAECKLGALIATVPAQARGFRINTPQAKVTDLGTTFGIEVKADQSRVHVFAGRVDVVSTKEAKHSLRSGEGLQADDSGRLKRISADASAFASLIQFQTNAAALQSRRYEQWREACTRLQRDSSLRAHFVFEREHPTEFEMRNSAGGGASDAAIVGCQWTEGRWPRKQALAFSSVSDRARFSVPGEFASVTLWAWVNVKGLDRDYNALFMCDGFGRGEIHWQIQGDGVLDLGVQGPRPTDVQVFRSPPVVGLTTLGQWIHLAAVIDGERREVSHYFNGVRVSSGTLKHAPPYRIGDAELGNWYPGEIPNKPAFLIRNFSGSIDEFALLSRALGESEIRQLYLDGAPEPGAQQVVRRQQ